MSKATLDLRVPHPGSPVYSRPSLPLYILPLPRHAPHLAGYPACHPRLDATVCVRVGGSPSLDNDVLGSSRPARPTTFPTTSSSIARVHTKQRGDHGTAHAFVCTLHKWARINVCLVFSNMCANKCSTAGTASKSSGGLAKEAARRCTRASGLMPRTPFYKTVMYCNYDQRYSAQRPGCPCYDIVALYNVLILCGALLCTHINTIMPHWTQAQVHADAVHISSETDGESIIKSDHPCIV